MPGGWFVEKPSCRPPMFTPDRILAGARGSCGQAGVLLAAAVLSLHVGCSGDVVAPADSPVNDESVQPVLRLATTTSTRDSGLLDRLLPLFEQEHACRVDVIAVGTGAALKLGAAGDVDVVLAHARQAEEAFMAAAHGVRHEEFMCSDFLILGPQHDPAEIRGLRPVEALTKIAQGSHAFVSRGDNSGTHQREMQLWQRAGIQPTWTTYLAVGQGMGSSLIMADEKQAYLLSDRGTFLRFREKIELVPLANVDQSSRNPYAAIVVHPEKHAAVNAELANTFLDFLISREGQQVIANYRMAGEQLFHPTRLESGS